MAESTTALANHTAPFISRATDLGAVESSKPLQITVWLKMNDTTRLDNTLKAQQAKKAPWLTNAQFEAAHAPNAADLSAVSLFLASRGLTVTGVGPHNLFVTASGTASLVQSAFSVELHQYSLGGLTFQANTSNPSLPSHVAAVVSAISGLTSHVAQPMNVRPFDADGAPFKPVAISPNPNGAFFSAQCFRPAETHTFTGGGATATYSGNRFGQDITNSTAGTLPPCGYQPSDLQTAYHMNPLYKAGLDGTGETVAIVDAFGSTTIRQDIATFSAVYGLPPADLTIAGTPTESPFSGDINQGWADETTLDVEWVHAIAPGAKILLVVTADNSFDKLMGGIAFASTQPGVVAISNSWSGQESGTDIPTRTFVDDILKSANAKGITVNFSTGDSGNETVNLGFADVDYPASSPFATGIGGVSVALRSDKRIAFQTSWGNNLTRIAKTAKAGNAPYDPPVNLGFQFGGGGGTSNVYVKPSFQEDLPGHRRLLPDISWVADPFTGVEIITSTDAAGGQAVSVIGGTSLSCPMFSGLWAIAAQRAGHNLGSAAHSVYRMPEGAIRDVTPVDSPDNISGVLTDASGTQNLTSSELASPLQGVPSFFSAMYNSPFSTRWFVITFGTDSTLATREGWDEATGVGTPDGANFVAAFGEDDQRKNK